jgi:hypothetical protein
MIVYAIKILKVKYSRNTLPNKFVRVVIKYIEFEDREGYCDNEEQTSIEPVDLYQASLYLSKEAVEQEIKRVRMIKEAYKYEIVEIELAELSKPEIRIENQDRRLDLEL